MKKILILVDMQKGFLPGETPRITDLIARTKQLINLDAGIFDCVIATQYVGPNKMMRRAFYWDLYPGQEDIEFFDELEIPKLADYQVQTVNYSCVSPGFLQQLFTINDGKMPEAVFVCGAETEASVLKTAADLFECGIQPIVLIDYCWSNGGVEAHLAGKTCLSQLIGDSFIWDGPLRRKGLKKRMKALLAES